MGIPSQRISPIVIFNVPLTKLSHHIASSCLSKFSEGFDGPVAFIGALHD